MKILFQGAESRIYVQDFIGKEVIVKERFKKNYRHPELDNHLTKERIKAECRNIVRCKQYGKNNCFLSTSDLRKFLLY